MKNKENTKRAVPIADNPNDPISLFKNFVEIVKILRTDCPWDRKQTNESIAPLLIEEAYETIDAIYEKNNEEFEKELGDLLLHIVMHCIMAEEKGIFDLKTVIEKISTKMINRHPHVFGEVNVNNEEEVLQNWEIIKKNEIKESNYKNSILDGVPKNLPALLRAERIQHKVSRVGFDWNEKNDIWNKVDEELQELKTEITKGDKERAREELGDFIFSIVNAARHEGLVAEESLHLTNNKFIKRFQFIEQRANQLGKDLNHMSLEEMDKIWEEAKKDN